MHLSDVISWIPSGLVETSSAPTGTGILTVGCSSPFSAVRIGFINAGGEDFRIEKVKACASSSWGDYVNPTGDGTWKDITFPVVNEGWKSPSSSVAVVTAASSPNSAPYTSAPVKWTWSNWVDLASLRPDPDTGMYVLSLRYFVSQPNQSISYMKGLFRGLTGSPRTNLGFHYFVGGINNGTDFLIGNARIDPDDATVNGLVNGSIVAGVQFLADRRGVIGMVGGDSHADGTGTSTQFNNFLMQLTCRLGSQFKGIMPFGFANSAFGGAQSSAFFSAFQSLLPDVRPSFAVVPGWTFNDPITDEAENQFAFLLDEAIAACRNLGCVLIVLTPIPRDPDNMHGPRLEQWLRRRDLIISLRKAGVLVIDAGALLGTRDGNGQLTGTYEPNLTGDSVHPNDRGHEIISLAIEAAVLSALAQENSGGSNQ